MDTKPGKHGNAHANFRRGMSDYNDGENVTHHLGNDDYKNGDNLPDPYPEGAEFDGKEAHGNQLDDDECNDQYEFYQKDDEQEETQRP